MSELEEGCAPKTAPKALSERAVEEIDF
jgi:hypothetical protein